MYYRPQKQHGAAGIAKERAAAFGLSSPQSVLASLCHEQSKGLALQGNHRMRLRFAAERGHVFPVPAKQRLHCGLSREEDAAFDVGTPAPVGPREANVAHAVQANQAAHCGAASASEIALDITALLGMASGLACEHACAFDVRVNQWMHPGVSREGDRAFGISAPQELFLDQARERDQSLALHPKHRLLLGRGGETNSALTAAISL